MSEDYEKIDVQQGTEEWLELRRAHVTATDYTILTRQLDWTTNKVKTPLTLYRQKKNKEVTEPNAFMLRGSRLEEEARRAAEEKLKITLMPMVARSKRYPWMMASIDGYNESTRTLVEIKCPLGSNMILAAEGKIPDHWKSQGDYQMTVLGVDFMYFFVYSDNGEAYLITHTNTLDKRIECIGASQDFYEYLKNDKEPPANEYDVLVIDDKEANQYAKALAEQIRNHKISEKILKELKLKVLDFTDDGDCEFPAVGLKITRCDGRETIDYKKMIEELKIPENILKKYTKQGIGYPKFTLKDEEE